MLAVSWLTWFVVRTQIQRTLEFQRKEIEFGRQQIRMGNQTILAIARTVDAKDGNTSMHSQRVSDYSVMLARELGFSDDECENLRKAALLHDIGKIAIPDRVLNKPGRLDDEEYAVMKTHVKYGADILKDFTLVDHVEEGARYHHERYDGSGYFEGLKGENIPLYGRIIAVADAFDAMTANRVYRKKQSFDYVLSEIEKGRGKQFDPVIADALLKLIDEGKIDVKALYATDPVDSAALVKDMAQAHREAKNEGGSNKSEEKSKMTGDAAKKAVGSVKDNEEGREEKA
jgi:energy-coupling factor transport system substrate-specific component